LAHAQKSIPMLTASWWAEGLDARWLPGSLAYPISGTGLTGTLESVITQRVWQQVGAGWVTRWQSSTMPMGAA
jgi:hypothetical protein